MKPKHSELENRSVFFVVREVEATALSEAR